MSTSTPSLSAEEAAFLQKVSKHDEKNGRMELNSARAIIVGFALQKRELLGGYFDGCVNSEVVYMIPAGRAALSAWEEEQRKNNA